MRAWFAWMEGRGVSISSIRKAKATLSAMAATAKEDGLVRHNAATGVRYVPAAALPPPRKLRPLTIEELDRFLRAVPAESRLLFLLLAHTGLRIGEVLGLNWKNLHLGDDAHLVVTDQIYEGERKVLKTRNAYRRVPLSPGMAHALSSWRERAEFCSPEDPVFSSSIGTPLSYANLWHRVLNPARKKANIQSAEVGGFHAFRRTLASVLHQSGEKSDRQLSDWLGHHDPGFTLRTYVGTLDAGVGDAAFLDEVIPVAAWATEGAADPTDLQSTDGFSQRKGSGD